MILAAVNAAGRAPELYTDLSYAIAFVTVLMAVLALYRLRPAVRNR